MDKLLILGAGPFQLHLIEQAQAMGAYVIVITPPGTYPGIKVADKVYYHDAKVEEYAFEVAQKEQVNGVISDQGEIFVRAVAYAAEKMGLPGNGYQTALLYTNKHMMRERTKELGLATIESKLVDNLEDAKKFFRSLNGTAIIKPDDSSSSRGVSKISSEKNLESKFDEAMGFSLGGHVIIERFVEGPQFEVDSLAVRGKVKPLMYADLDEFDIPDVFSSKSRLYPSVADAEVIEKLLSYNQKINEGFGLVQGMTHNEYIMDENTGEIYLIEAALRGGGTYIASHIAKLQTGIDTAEFLVNIALGRIEDVPEYEMNQCHGGYIAFYLPVGEVVSVEGLDEVEQLDYVVKTTFDRIHLGMKTDSIVDKNQRHAIVLHAETRELLNSRIDEVKKLIKVKVSTEDGLKDPLWD